MKQKTKALVLFSGGLDSRLVVKLLQEQGLEVELINFKLPSGCSCGSSSDSVFDFSQDHKAKLVVVDCTKGTLFREYLNILKHPKFSRGKNMNPCIDCKIFMFRKAKEYADKNSIKIIATGEVLGERPLSQTSKALGIIDKELGFELLRPLSAKLFPETNAEKEKLVDREKFFDINGRRREIQMKLAEKFNITYPTPGGGCLLCEKAYSGRLKDIFRNKKESEILEEEFETLGAFRHFKSPETKKKILLGRNEKENILLAEINKGLKWNILISPETRPGPTAIFESDKDKSLAAQLIKAYSSKNLEERKKFGALLVSS